MADKNKQTLSEQLDEVFKKDNIGRGLETPVLWFADDQKEVTV